MYTTFSYTLLIYTPQIVNYSSLMLMNIFQNVVREWVKYGQDLSLKNKQKNKKKTLLPSQRSANGFESTINAAWEVCKIYSELSEKIILKHKKNSEN